MKVLALLATLGLLATAASAAWTIEAPHLATIVMGVSCSNTRLCFAGAGQNGLGVLAFAFNGTAWGRVPIDPQPAQMMFMSTAANAAGVAVIGGIGSPGTQAGNSRGFRNSEIDNVLVTVTQNVGTVRGMTHGFGFAGDFVGEETGEGVAISSDGGKTFSLFPIDRSLMHGWARYADYPSPAHWVVSTGSWPTASGARQAAGVHHLSSRLSVATDAASVTGLRVHVDTEARAAADASSYKAGITVSTDAGRTWRQTFQADGHYFNQVKCANTRTCYVVGEGRTAVIYKTTDGGMNWSKLYESPAHLTVDLMGLEVISDSDVWACGMEVRDRSMIGLFMHSTDGGLTWDVQTLPGYFCVDMSFPSRTVGKAALVDQNGQSHIAAFRA